MSWPLTPAAVPKAEAFAAPIPLRCTAGVRGKSGAIPASCRNRASLRSPRMRRESQNLGRSSDERRVLSYAIPAPDTRWVFVEIPAFCGSAGATSSPRFTWASPRLIVIRPARDIRDGLAHKTGNGANPQDRRPYGPGWVCGMRVAVAIVTLHNQHPASSAPSWFAGSVTRA